MRLCQSFLRVAENAHRVYNIPIEFLHGNLVIYVRSSELGLGLLQILDGTETRITRVLNDLLGLPVSREDGGVGDTNRGHLESEQIHVWLDSSLAHRVVSGVENGTVLEETTRESSEDDDLIFSDLNDTSTLSLSELRGWDVDDNP